MSNEVPGGPGVYLLLNRITNAAYVGMAQCLSKRISQHRVLMQRGRHRNHRVQEEVDQHGFASFEYGILEECSLPELPKRELHWIAKVAPSLNGRFDVPLSVNQPRNVVPRIKLRQLADARGSAPISVDLPTEELRDAFFMWCRQHKPRMSMNERLLQHIKADLGIEPVAKPKPHAKPPRPR